MDSNQLLAEDRCTFSLLETLCVVEELLLHVIGSKFHLARLRLDSEHHVVVICNILLRVLPKLTNEGSALSFLAVILPQRIVELVNDFICNS